MKSKYKIAGIGELLWDMLPQGNQLGGAPCNFAFHALQAGCDAYFVSDVGSDKEGEEIHSAATNGAAFVCAMHGATPKLPEHLLSQIDRQ